MKVTRKPARWIRAVALLATSIALAAGALRAQVALSQQAEPPRPPESQARVASVEFDPAELAWLAAHPVIRVGAETNYAPYEYIDSRGKFAGVVSDYLEIIKRRLPVQFQVFPLLNFATVEDKLEKRELDVVLAVTPAQERQPFLIFTKPYLQYVNVIVTRDDYGFVSGLRDFAPERVAVVRAHSSHSLMVKAYPNRPIRTYPDILEGLMAVSTGKVDGLVDDIFPIVFNIRQRQISNLKIATPVERVLQPKGFSVGIRSDWPQLVGILDKVLAAITDAEEQAISQKWLSIRYESKVDYRVIWTSLAVFSTILVAGVLYIRLLSAQRRALMAARAELEAASRSKDQFLANMSHELRTPLHAILGYAELMRERALSDPGRQEALSTIARSGRHLLDLINDLLDLSRIRSGRLELHPSPVSLPALVGEIAAMVRVEAEKKGLQFTLDAPSELQALVETDGKRLRQILLNLLGNAIKFTAAGRVTLSVHTVPLKNDHVELRAEVRDTGVGIALEDAARIFAPFEQAEPGRKRESGVGLGLAISQELAHLMGGDIQVESRPNAGSNFRFTVALPIVRGPMAVQPVNRQVIGYQGPTKSILVADDQQENRQLLQHLLEPLGFEVLPAAGGQEAVSSAQKRRPDLIVMDLRMPEMSGFEAAHAIHQSRALSNVPIVAASASTADLERAQADQKTFAACLRKPFEGIELLGIVGSLLNLTWRYEGAAGTDSASIAEPVETRPVAPPGAVLDELLQLARLGKLVRIEQIALRMERGEARYRPFARRLYALARDLDEDRLIALLQEAAGEQRDVATH
jgi:signal transduction histidine kinase/DNA-binding response OmpR family regulator